jgi:hypothetical protein
MAVVPTFLANVPTPDLHHTLHVYVGEVAAQTRRNYLPFVRLALREGKSTCCNLRTPQINFYIRDPL